MVAWLVEPQPWSDGCGRPNRRFRPGCWWSRTSDRRPDQDPDRHPQADRPRDPGGLVVLLGILATPPRDLAWKWCAPRSLFSSGAATLVVASELLMTHDVLIVGAGGRGLGGLGPGPARSARRPAPRSLPVSPRQDLRLGALAECPQAGGRNRHRGPTCRLANPVQSVKLVTRGASEMILASNAAAVGAAAARFPTTRWSSAPWLWAMQFQGECTSARPSGSKIAWTAIRSQGRGRAPGPGGAVRRRLALRSSRSIPAPR